MTQVDFYEKQDGMEFQYAVILARYEGKWILCRHKDRKTLEFPGGHWEEGEEISQTARRELYEETGAEHFRLREISAYSVRETTASGEVSAKSCGMLYYAEVTGLGALPGFEIEEVLLCEELPENWTYPSIQPLLLKKAKEMGIYKPHGMTVN